MWTNGPMFSKRGMGRGDEGGDERTRRGLGFDGMQGIKKRNASGTMPKATKGRKSPRKEPRSASRCFRRHKTELVRFSYPIGYCAMLENMHYWLSHLYSEISV